MKKYYKYVLSLGHLCSDINQSILSAVLPFLIAANHYDYATAAMLVTVSNVFGSLVQPFIGILSDRKNKPWVMPMGVLLASGGMAITGYTSNFYALCIAVILSGIGVAMFHPQAAKYVNAVSHKNSKGKGMSIFSFGGKIGFTLGPVYTAFLLNKFKMKGTILFLVPGIIFCIVCLFFNRKFKNLELDQKEKKEEIIQREDNKIGFIKLCAVVFSRSILSNGLNTFLALYFIDQFSKTTSSANFILSLFYGLSALATLLGGSIADHIGHRKMIRMSFFIFLPSLFIFTYTKNYLIALLMLVGMSCGESFSYSPMVVLGQEYLPHHTGFASGITLGLAVSIGAVVCPLLGYVSDQYGLNYAFHIMTGICLIALICSLLLPNVKEETKC